MNSQAMRPNRGFITTALGIVTLLFIFSSVFDPADLLFKLKIPLFAGLWGLTFLSVLTSDTRRIMLPPGLVIYVVLFILVPVLSVLWYSLTNGAQPYEGVNMLKGYILISIAVLLVINRINLLPKLSFVLNILAVVIIITSVVLTIEPDLYVTIYAFGNDTGIVLLDSRDYGTGIKFFQVYFVTSPMLVVPIAYSFSKMKASRSRKQYIFYLSIVVMNVAAMILAGTRNNILISVLLTVALWFFYTENKKEVALIGFIFIIGLVSTFSVELQSFFSPKEYSNSIKLQMVQDYLSKLSDWQTVWFGQGLGAYTFWSAKNKFFYVGELTYFEMVRNFGLAGGMIMAVLLLLPLWRAIAYKIDNQTKALAIAYTFYLIGCFSNPNLFSSMGILILSVLVANLYMSNIDQNKTNTISVTD